MSKQKNVDVLDEDKPIAGQKFVCISFISPETLIKQRAMYDFEQFVSKWDIQKSLERFNGFLGFIAFKYKLDAGKLNEELQGFCKEECDKLNMKSSLEDEFKNFQDTNADTLLKDFNKTHNFQTSVRGIKVRGAFPSQEEAELRCKMLREVDPNHDVYVGPVGLWMPFHPEAYKTGRVEYLEEELNQLMHEKNKNEQNAKTEFEKRVKDAKINAIAENVKKAKEHGTSLSQTVDTNGNLINVKDLDNIPEEDLRKVLFEDPNVVTDKNNDHGYSKLPMSESKKDKIE